MSRPRTSSRRLPPSWTASLAALALAGGAAALSGCGGDDEPSPAVTPPPAGTTTAAAPPATGTAAPTPEPAPLAEQPAPEPEPAEQPAAESDATAGEGAPAPSSPTVVEPEAGVPAESAAAPESPAAPADTRAQADAAAPTGTAAPAPAARLTVHLRRPVDLRARPGGPVVARLTTRTEFGTSRVLPVLRQSGRWLAVLSSDLPNGRAGWIRSDATMQGHRNTWRVDASLRRREVVVRKDGRVVDRFPVAIGSAGTPTPTGRFAVTDKLFTGSASSPYGCCILALSGRQTQTPQGWGGGDRLAIHATNLPETIGSAASLGCLRAPETAARRLVDTVPLGTIVTIRA